MAIRIEASQDDLARPFRLNAPDVVPEFRQALDDMVATARKGHRRDSEFFNPDGDWLKSRMRIFQDLPEIEQREVLKEVEDIGREAKAANSQGKAAMRAGPDVVFRLDNGGMACYSQLGVARRPDLTRYFIEDFAGNRDSLSFSVADQRLFVDVLPYVTRYMEAAFAEGARIIQSDRQVCDAPGRSFHARQLLFGDRYPQLPYLWRQLTFELPESEFQESPDILEVSVPHWLEDLGMPDDLVARVKDAGLNQLVFRSPTRGLSFHLGFDYLGEHKMGPLSIAMFLVKQKNGLAVQAALSMARAKTIHGEVKNTAVVTAGPSLHGKSTLTIMMEFEDSDLARLLGLVHDPEEGVYPMNDDIILLHPLDEPIDTVRDGNRLRISYGIDGTENNLYAVPYGLNRQDDPITYDVVRGTEGAPNPQESLENVVVDPSTGVPDYSQNPVRNMRMILSRTRLIERKSASHLLSIMTDGRVQSSVHVPMTDTDRIFWQAVMRQNTVIPPLRRLSLEQYVRVLMYGEAVQMGAAIGAIGRPYVEYFSDPFIIGLEDENANLLYHILQQLSWDGMPQNYYVFNTGGVGADSNDEAGGTRYRKIPRELTLMLQEALLRDAVRFEYDSAIRSEVAVAVLNLQGEEILDLRQEWLPINIYGASDYTTRVVDLRRRRYYGVSSEDKAGILRYTKATDALLDLGDVPAPANERELAWLLSFHWNTNNAYNTLQELGAHRSEGSSPCEYLIRALQWKYDDGTRAGLSLSGDAANALRALGLRP
ncbi:MAG: phosphoenolpyruvate carboxykinase (ATP) [Chloroflexi bacterium]|nr:phosphoenolpyruvate carboxykinase (ATP) [Chloroflexota bacterium]